MAVSNNSIFGIFLSNTFQSDSEIHVLWAWIFTPSPNGMVVRLRNKMVMIREY